MLVSSTLSSKFLFFLFFTLHHTCWEIPVQYGSMLHILTDQPPPRSFSTRAIQKRPIPEREISKFSRKRSEEDAVNREEKKKRTRQKEQQVYRYRKGISQGKKVFVASREGVGVTVPEVISDQEADVISPIKQSTASALWMQWSPSAQWIQ